MLHQDVHRCFRHFGGSQLYPRIVLSSSTGTRRTTTAVASAWSVPGTGVPRPSLSNRRTGRVKSVAIESLTGQPVVLGSYDEAAFEPSNDLRELAAAQLQSLFQVLRRIAGGTASSYGSCKACVYARRADSLDAPQMKLQRVACCKSAHLHSSASLGFTPYGSSNGSNPSSINSFEELDEILTLHRAAWEPGSSSSAGGCETEALLINEEIVLLPSSNLLVLPLAEAGVLVGLLVVEVVSKAGTVTPHQPQPLQQQQQGQGQPVWELPPVLGLSEDVLWALRMSVPPLAKACAMDLRTALAGAQQEARQRLARSLLLEARGPLKVLDTFGSMLAPRLRTGQGAGEPESDMADGMLLQGQRLADVVAQLEAALRPAAAPRGAGNAGLISSSSSGMGWDVVPQQQQQQQSWREPLALPAAAMDDGNLSDEDDSWAFADSSSLPLPQHQQQLAQGVGPQAAAVAVSSQVMPPAQQQQQRSPSLPQQPQQQPVAKAPKLLGPAGSAAQQQQAVVVTDLVPGQHSAGDMESSSRDIRWKQVASPPSSPAAAAVVSVPPQPSSIMSSSAASSNASSGCVYAVRNQASFDAARTIDLEVQPQEALTSTDAAAAVDTSSISSSSSSSSATASAVDSTHGGLMQLSASSADAAVQQQKRQQRQQQTKQPPKRPAGVCNVVDVLSHLLSAAAGLAQMQGINLIVNGPLSVDPPISSSSRAGAAAASSSSTSLVLLPRPVRPLLAGVAGHVCRRVLGYCVDVALQCTPRGGQLCVTARASSGGVEVSLLHTGQAQPSRLHTSTASMDAAALGPQVSPAPALAAAEGGSPTGAAGTLLRKRKRQQPAAAVASASHPQSSVSVSGSSTGSSSGSSRWNTGLQELSSGSGIRGGSSLITLDFARQILHSVGGSLHLHYPYHFMNAMTGQLEVGSNIEVWLPPPAATASGG